MLTMTNAHTIREIFFKEGRNITEIAQYSGILLKTVQNTLEIMGKVLKEDFKS